MTVAVVFDSDTVSASVRREEPPATALPGVVFRRRDTSVEAWAAGSASAA
ncbi:MAG: hypothetical protein HYX54_04040 [Chloroflexi bacterium]|nr:hypothetical protein [Chloroflexota bacterium]